MSLSELATVLCLLVAAFFFLAGTLGIVRFPDALARLHAVTKADNLALGFVILGLVFQAGSVLAAAKLLLVWIVALIASATSCFLVANYAEREGDGGQARP